MWRLWHKWFGWDYVYFTGPYHESAKSSVYRVKLDGMQRPYIIVKHTLERRHMFIEDPKTVVWMTCDATKYMTLHLLKATNETSKRNL